MNGSYGQYGRWNGSGVPLGYTQAAQAVLSPGTTITGPSEPGFDTLTAVSAGGNVLSSASSAGAASSKKGVRALASSGKIVGGGAGLVGTAAAAGLPLNAIPVAGQIAFVALVAGVATFALIKGLRSGHISKKEADALAKKAGLDSEMKHYVRKVVRMKRSKLFVELAKERKRYAKKKKGGLHAIGRSKKRIKQKIDIVRQMIEYYKAEAKAKAKAKAAGASDAAIAADTTALDGDIGAQITTALSSVGIPSTAVLPLGLGLGALVLFLLFRPRRGGT